MSDLISRQDAIKALWKALYDYEDKTEKQFLQSNELSILDWMQHRIFVQDMNDIDRQTILELPSVEPERKTGKWISVESNTVNGICSVCGYESHLYENDVYGEHYCPNCGAQMENE